MARVAEWTVTEASGRQHRIRVDRMPILGARVTVDRRLLGRFDQTLASDRYVTALAGHVLTVTAPRGSSGQPTLDLDGEPVLGTETTLPAPATAVDRTAATVSSRDLRRFQLQRRRNNGGAWFYWIGAASILNSVLDAAGSAWGLPVGLGVTYLIDGVARGLSNTVRTPIYAFTIDLAIASGFLFIGRAARRGNLSWYAVGIGLYLLDGLVFVLGQDLLGIAMTKRACPYSTGAPPVTRTSRISPSAGALISATWPSDWIPPSTSPRATASPVVHSRAALNSPTVVAWTRCVFSTGSSSGLRAGVVPGAVGPCRETETANPSASTSIVTAAPSRPSGSSSLSKSSISPRSGSLSLKGRPSQADSG